jgi:hypothetical protein
MSLNRGQINPLGVLGSRKLSFIPAHFKKIFVSSSIDAKIIDHWISYNLNSRYAIKKNFIVNDQNKITEVLEIGIEDQKEITILTLGCSHLHNQKEIF